MKNEKCEKMMDAFLALDKDERMPLSLSLHLLSCQHCRSQVRLLTRAECLASSPLCSSSAEVDTSLSAILQKIADTKPLPNPISLRRWVVSGILMVLLMLSFMLYTAGNSSELKIAFYLVFALIITTYCAMFIGSNIDFFIKKINTQDFSFFASL